MIENELVCREAERDQDGEVAGVYVMQVRAILKRLVPRPLRRSVRLRKRIEKFGGVIAGPFQGMRYVGQAIGSSLGPKILGTYELEIESVILDVLARSPHKIVVVGAGEGYYAVGFATKLPRAEIVAFESNPEAHPLLRELARLNEVEKRVAFRGFCTPGALAECLAETEGAFLLMDVEGAEGDLLNPALIPQLGKIEILVETHDSFVPGVEAELIMRFQRSHEIQPYRQRLRTTADVRNLRFPGTFSGALATWLPEDRPPGNHWLHLRARA